MAACFSVCRAYVRGADRLLRLCPRCELQAQTGLSRLHRTGFATAAQAVSNTEQTAVSDAKESFSLIQEKRHDQAERSVLINCPPNTNKKKFLAYISKHGDIRNHFFYETYGIYAVVEFSSRDSISSLKENCTIPSLQHEASVPFKSRLLTLSSTATGKKQTGPNAIKCHNLTPPSFDKLINQLSKQETVDQQMQCLTEACQLTEENISLRFLVCSLLRDIAAAYFPDCIIRPFGSTVNSFGKLGCDLDMFLDLDAVSGHDQSKGSGLSLEYQVKRGASERNVTQSILSVIGECVDVFSPGCVGVQKILNARCPLVRFSHQPSSFRCDLTANNRVAMKSSEMLFIYGSLDERLRFLVFTIRYWARAHGITNSFPGAWITNFSLTMLVVFFLQQRTPALLPTLNQLRDLAGPSDKCVIEGNDCTMVTDLSKITLQQNTDTLEKLLQEFFEFYGSFDFGKSSINIRKGREQNKPETSAMHIQNPFETDLNVSRNVNSSQLQRFVTLCKESAWIFQNGDVLKRRSASSSNKIPQWGVAALLMPSVTKSVEAREKRKRRKNERTAERIMSVLQSLKSSGSEGYILGITKQDLREAAFPFQGQELRVSRLHSDPVPLTRLV
ncbi:poly(A) RNA polymerase, mitochondrial [Astyanax mexicanus]|uniref:Poly(A) RNA polymerase, mitochondrial n=1 Tax=Astyanax mexicanus TaxID=7994 RepID=A0A8T2LDE9_ASTMX|nr:poly(A) RNA polymerase, mitochondrial [Astyanax mexicanus]